MLLGRDEIVHSLASQSVRRRLVTIVGPAGIGKSCVASAIAERVTDRYEHGTRRVDLATVNEEQPLEVALASALGFSLLSSNPRDSLIAHLSPMELLLVIDNCEHMLGPLAYIVEEIVRCTPKIDVVLTSREPLRCSGEWLFRLPSLPVPAQATPSSIDQALQSAAVGLFVHSAAKSFSEFKLSQTNLAAVISICRQLDGIPLAIQLVAARVRNFSVEELARAVSRQPLLLTTGWRSPHVTHHASLRAALDWTYTRLTEAEQLLFRRLAVFRGPFSLAAAIEVVGENPKERGRVTQDLLSLAENSLVSFEASSPQTPYRLLHLTRSYALEKLIAAGEFNALLRRHASYYHAILSEQTQNGLPMWREEWLNRHQNALDDIRAALDWAFSEGGDPIIAAGLTAMAIPLIFQLCSINESQRWIDSALKVISRSEKDSLIPQVNLCFASCAIYLNAGAPQHAGLLDSAQRAVDVADRTHDELLRTTARVMRIVADLTDGNPPGAIARLAELQEIAACAQDPHVGIVYDRVSAQAFHFNGDFPRSRQHAQRTLIRQPVPASILYSNYNIDPHISMRIILARNAWLEGRADEAHEITNECVKLARKDTPFTLSQALTLCACPIAFWRGDLAAARSFTNELAERARPYGLNPGTEFARCCEVVLAQAHGEDTNVPEPAHPANILQRDHLCTFSNQWLNGATLSRAEQGLTGWCTSEIFRRHGEMILQRNDVGSIDAADQLFRRALAIARAQGAHAWEVRICTSLARLHQDGPGWMLARQDLEIAYRSLQGTKCDEDAIQARRLLEA